jgi:hypothetical protein
MVQLTPHDTAVLSRLVQFGRLPDEKRKLLEELRANEAKMVGDALLDKLKYSEAPPRVRATVDRFREWSVANRRLGRLRTGRRRVARN